MNSPQQLNRIVQRMMQDRFYIHQRDEALRRCQLLARRELPPAEFQTEAQLIAEAIAERDARRARGGGA
jgi:hypothetical protein